MASNNGVVTATVTVSFANSAEGEYLTAEIDSREDGPNEGKTSFSPGDDVYLLVRKSPGLDVTGYATVGSVAIVGNVSGLPESDFLTFPRTRTAELSQVPEGAVRFQWFGAIPGSPVVKGKTVNLTGPYDKKNPPIGVCEASYTSKAESWRLSGIPATLGGKSSFQVLVVLVGEKAP